MEAYTFGRNSSNDIQIDHPSLSGQSHLSLEKTINGVVMLYHQGQNETKVNGRAVKKIPLEITDRIEIGGFKMSGEEMIKLVNKEAYKFKTDFSQEYKELLDKYRAFEAQKEKIEKPSLKPIFLKVGISGGVILILLLFPDLVPNQSFRYPMIAGAGLLATAFSGTGSNSKKKAV